MAMPNPITLLPIGFVRGGRTAPNDDSWDGQTCRIELDSRFGPEALLGLSEFSHIEVIFHFDRAGREETGARHPRGRADWPLMGIFAQRGKDRPNRLGVSTCRLLAVEGILLTVQGLDAIDGSPVLDIKPVIKGFLPRGALREPGWAREIMKDYWVRTD